jgi:hypothetical protein
MRFIGEAGLDGGGPAGEERRDLGPVCRVTSTA